MARRAKRGATAGRGTAARGRPVARRGQEEDDEEEEEEEEEEGDEEEEGEEEDGEEGDDESGEEEEDAEDEEGGVEGSSIEEDDEGEDDDEMDEDDMEGDLELGEEGYWDSRGGASRGTGKVALSSRRKKGGARSLQKVTSFSNFSAGNGSARRSRRVKPLDVSKELIVLMPGDDPVEKLGLEEHELPEFICCMQEDYQEEEPVGGDGHGHGHHADPHVPAGAEVLVPEVTIVTIDAPIPLPRVPPSSGAAAAAAGGGAGAGRGGPKGKRSAGQASSSSVPYPYRSAAASDFVLGRPGDVSVGSTYTTYNIESDDEEFLHSADHGLEGKKANGKAAAGAAGRKGSNGKATSAPSSSSSSSLSSSGVTEEMFCAMMASLEREMVVSLSYSTGRAEAEMARQRCLDGIESAEKMLSIVEAMGSNPVKAVEKLEKIATEMEERAPLVPTPQAARILGASPRAGAAAGAVTGGAGEDDHSDRGLPHSKSRHRFTGHERDLPRFSVSALEELVPFAAAGYPVLLRTFRAYSHPSSSSSSSGAGAGAEAELKAALLRVYQYWAHKRSSRSVSLLRCYHTFIMENWKVQEDLLPAHPEDKEPAALVSAHEKLVKLRRDLDRARLIIDRVRRRDKLKRELVRVAGESLETFLAGLPVAPDEAEDEDSPKKGAKGGSGGSKAKGGKDADKEADKPARAAKESAKERLTNPGVVPGRHGAGDEDSGDDGPLPFTLDDVNYDLLEAPKPTVSLYGMGREEDRRVSHHKGGHRRLVPQGSAGGAAASGWTADEDHLLLLGVAACGVGRWTEIREDFLLSRNSAQMNQRFTRLARRRCVLVKITGNSSGGVPGKKSSGPKGKGEESEEEEPDQASGEYTEVRTAFMTGAEVQRARSKLPPILVDMLEKYVEDHVWESIALRHLFDTQSKEKRCGRPQKYPLPIPIPKHLQNGGWVSRKKNLVQRPSALVPGWQPGAGGGYGLGVGSYQPSASGGGAGAAASMSSGYDTMGGSLPQPSPRPRGRPRKHPPKRESDDDATDPENERVLEAPADNSEWEARKAAQAAALARRKEEQDQLREERIKARGRTSALDALADAAAGSSSTAENSSKGSRTGKRAPRCSLGSLQAPGRKGRGRRGSGEDEDDDDEDEDEDEEDEEEEDAPRQAAGRRNAKRPRL